MPKPSQFRFVPADPTITKVAWWGERLMAAMILVTVAAVRTTTSVPRILETGDYVVWTLNAAAVVYGLTLIKIMVVPTRPAHQFGLPLGVLVFGARTIWFGALWFDLGRGGWGNILERAMLTASVVVYHTWGLWSDRRALTQPIR